MSQFIPPFDPPFGRKQKTLEFYMVNCTKCEWTEPFVLAPCEMIVIPAPGETEPQGPQHVTELPKRCPKCGARVEKTKIPGVIKH